MTAEEMAFGILGIGLFSLMLYYTLIILNNFKEHETVSAAMFFLDNRGPISFQIVVGAAAIYSVGMLYAALGTAYNEPILGLLSKSTALILFAGFLYFLRNIAVITATADEREILTTG